MSGGPASPWAPVPLSIVRRTRETADTFTLRLDPGDRAYAFAPGQFNMLYVFGVGEVAISISGDPQGDDSLVHTIRAVGTVTRAIGQLSRGATLGVRGPFGRGWPIDEAAGRDVLVIAGGLGLAPLRPVLYHLIRHRDRYGRVTLLYGARSPEDLLYASELARWRARGVLEAAVTVDHASGKWSGPVGVVPALIDTAGIDPAATLAMVCGPEVMMRFCVRALQARGVPAARIYLSLERNMKCALRWCGHCQYRESFLCKDGPVLPFERIADILERREI